jgi:hypothetical protein
MTVEAPSSPKKTAIPKKLKIPIPKARGIPVSNSKTSIARKIKPPVSIPNAPL